MAILLILKSNNTELNNMVNIITTTEFLFQWLYNVEFSPLQSLCIFPPWMFAGRLDSARQKRVSLEGIAGAWGAWARTHHRGLHEQRGRMTICDSKYLITVFTCRSSCVQEGRKLWITNQKAVWSSTWTRVPPFKQPNIWTSVLKDGDLTDTHLNLDKLNDK